MDSIQVYSWETNEKKKKESIQVESTQMAAYLWILLISTGKQKLMLCKKLQWTEWSDLYWSVSKISFILFMREKTAPRLKSLWLREII